MWAVDFSKGYRQKAEGCRFPGFKACASVGLAPGKRREKASVTFGPGIHLLKGKKLQVQGSHISVRKVGSEVNTNSARVSLKYKNRAAKPVVESV